MIADDPKGVTLCDALSLLVKRWKAEMLLSLGYMLKLQTGKLAGTRHSREFPCRRHVNLETA